MKRVTRIVTRACIIAEPGGRQRLKPPSLRRRRRNLANRGRLVVDRTVCPV